MAKITYIAHDGETEVLDVERGSTVMRGAVDNAVQGIIGDCGGACSCATCHVYVDPQWYDKVGEIGAMEAILLEEVCDPQPNSRLGCQIAITDELDGLVVRLPEKQV
ncbi:MAG: (2Fe-2S)-binding protein [Halioglobus sp.]|nr:(2Fe-2S)-binding protein [Halioglobus sp.]